MSWAYAWWWSFFTALCVLVRGGNGLTAGAEDEAAGVVCLGWLGMSW